MVFRTILNKYHKSGILKTYVQYLTDCIQRMSHSLKKNVRFARSI